MIEVSERQMRFLRAFVHDLFVSYTFLHSTQFHVLVPLSTSPTDRIRLSERLAARFIREGMVLPHEQVISARRIQHWVDEDELALVLDMLLSGECDETRVVSRVSGWYRKHCQARRKATVWKEKEKEKEKEHERVQQQRTREQRQRQQPQAGPPGVSTEPSDTPDGQRTAATTSVSPMLRTRWRTGASTGPLTARTRRVPVGRTGWRDGRAV